MALTNRTSIGPLGTLPPRTPSAGALWALFSLGPCSDSNRWHFRKQRLRSLGYAKVTAIRIAGVQEAIAGAQEGGWWPMLFAQDASQRLTGPGEIVEA